MPDVLTLEALQRATTRASAIRAVLTLQPAAGKGAKVFPSTYGASQDGRDKDRFGETKYAVEERRVDGRTVACALLDSVASQANRMEQALLAGWERGEFDFPVLQVDFTEADLPERIGVISALDAPHRVYDAIFRDSVDAGGVLFRYTDAGKQLTAASPRDATALYQYCPTALIFGAWDSTGPRGGMGSKFPRAISSEIVAIDVVTGVRVQSRIDPLQITKVMDVAYRVKDSPDWMTEPSDKKDKSVAPSEVNHGNVTPSRDTTNGGVTFDHARQTTVVSLAALRRLRFPTTGSHEATEAAHTALSALALLGITAAYAEGYDLRSGTLLVGEGPLTLEVVEPDGRVSAYVLDAMQAKALFDAACARAAAQGLGWARSPIPALKPAPKLVHLLRESQKSQVKRRADADQDA